MSTIAEYLEIERAAESRSEYLYGTIVPMASATRNRGRIAAATLSWLCGQLRRSACGAAGCNTLLYIAKFDVAIHPDVVVTCGPDRFLDKERDVITDATLIVEVISLWAENYERFRYYRGLPSFAEYLLLAQDAIRAEHHVRQPDGSWLFREISESTAVIELTSIGCRLPLAALYERVQFEKPA